MSQNREEIPHNLLEEIHAALKNVTFGSVEIFVQDSTVTQITVRNIKKTSVGIQSDRHPSKTIDSIQTRNKIRINLHS